MSNIFLNKNIVNNTQGESCSGLIIHPPHPQLFCLIYLGSFSESNHPAQHPTKKAGPQNEPTVFLIWKLFYFNSFLPSLFLALRTLVSQVCLWSSSFIYCLGYAFFQLCLGALLGTGSVAPDPPTVYPDLYQTPASWQVLHQALCQGRDWTALKQSTNHHSKSKN